jgi:hypothetical protein
MPTRAGRLLFLAAALPFVASCATLDTPLEKILRMYAMPSPTRELMSVCRSFGCRETLPVSLDQAEWARVVALFDPPAQTPGAERAQVALAVGLFETLVGPKAGTDRDAAGNRWNRTWSPQLDCIAEAVNSTVYLLLLEQTGLLRHHRVAHPARRTAMLIFPHNSAVLVEQATGSAFAVDSWFHANGVPPEIVPLELWKAGYDPRPTDGHQSLRGQP